MSTLVERPTDPRFNEDRGPANDIAARLRAATPLVDHVEVQTIDGQTVASVYLDAVIARGRAEQQGLADNSIAAAARAVRVERLLTSAVSGSGATCQIVIPGGAVVAVDGALA
jgi:hypothetical protein